ncbi:MAG: galactokinase [Lachnospiraceae bacterium]|nr:galactokinase [Lachnospiraceae bacterium]
MNMINILKQEFNKIFKKDALGVYFAPGRINLIGEHTDYNGGYVFPYALSIGTYALVSKRDDFVVRMYSMNFENEGINSFELSTDKLLADNWCKYPLAVVNTLKDHGYNVNTGFDVLYYGEIPNGAGLSSSASIEVVTANMLRDIGGFGYTDKDMALMCQEAENVYAGVNCGIMDQFAIALGKKEHAIFLDTKTLEYEYAPLKLAGLKIVIMNTNKKRKLGESKYNERRCECEKALESLKKILDVKCLCDVSVEEFEANKQLIEDDNARKRAKHVIYENARTKEAFVALCNNDFEKFGSLMNASHTSLKEDYEVTGIELDTLVAKANKCKGVIGARMTGAGFGGCAFAIVKEAFVDEFIEKVGNEYKNTIGYEAMFYVM